MKGRGTARRPAGLEWREGGDDVGDGYDGGFRFNLKPEG